MKRAEERMDEIKPVILEIVKVGEKINAANGFFEMKKRDNWKYSEDIEAREKELKGDKAEEVAKGLATNNPTFYVQYNENK